MPLFLSFAAGAMLYVVIEELIPECEVCSNCTQEQIFFALGFTIMMALDVALG
jgi:ZIP family zinc transporter